MWLFNERLQSIHVITSAIYRQERSREIPRKRIVASLSNCSNYARQLCDLEAYSPEQKETKRNYHHVKISVNLKFIFITVGNSFISCSVNRLWSLTISNGVVRSLRIAIVFSLSNLER